MIDKKSILKTYKSLGIIDVSSKRQLNNGTKIFAIHNTISDRTEYFGSYSSGYVRRTTNAMYPINKKRFERTRFGFSSKSVLIQNEVNRLQFLLNYLVKNYIFKPETVIEKVYKVRDGLTIKCNVEKNCLSIALDHLREHFNDLIIDNRKSDKDSPDNLFINELEILNRIESVDGLIKKVKKYEIL